MGVPAGAGGPSVRVWISSSRPRYRLIVQMPSLRSLTWAISGSSIWAIARISASSAACLALMISFAASWAAVRASSMATETSLLEGWLVMACRCAAGAAGGAASVPGDQEPVLGKVQCDRGGDLRVPDQGGDPLRGACDGAGGVDDGPVLQDRLGGHHRGQGRPVQLRDQCQLPFDLDPVRDGEDHRDRVLDAEHVVQVDLELVGGGRGLGVVAHGVQMCGMTQSSYRPFLQAMKLVVSMIAWMVALLVNCLGPTA